VTNGGNKLRQLYWMNIWHVNSSVKTHSLSPSHVWKLSSFFYREKQSLLTVELKNLTTKQRKKSLRLWCGFLAKCFSTGWETVCKKLLNLIQVALTKIPRNEAKIYQETEFHSSEGYLFNFSWLLPGLLKLLHWMLYRLDLPLEVLTSFC